MDKILFLDIGSICTGFCLVSFNPEKSKASKIEEVGFVKFDIKLPHGYRYKKMAELITDEFYIKGINRIVAESFRFNPKNPSGCLAPVQMHGAIMAACYETGTVIDFETVEVSTWKKKLIGNGRAEKSEIEYFIKTMYPNLPKKAKNPHTKKENKTPQDVYDVLGITSYWLAENNYSIESDIKEIKGLYFKENR